MDATYSEHPAMFKNNPLGFLLAILLIPVGIGIIILLVWYLKCKSTLLELSGSELVVERGLLSKDRTELALSSIRTVNVYQSFFNRIFGVGKIAIYTAGDEAEIEVAGLPDPHRLRELIKAQQAA
ncbi:PH domain-containing protein [Marinobacterium aestuariivivens]|uniref:PH domain-containing protein n=1 Tax=Marinobacterium aestuariivivens TaxID=1698799 RepID=A0ABW2A2P9_9GAMM